MGYLVAQKSAPTKALVCTLAVALMLAGTRWGSYIGYSPLFITDILIAIAVVDRFLGRAEYGTPKVSGGRSSPTVIFTIFFTYVSARGLFSVDHILTMNWVRDLMPFLYGILAFISADSFARSNEAERKKTMKYIWWALIFHLFWISAVVLAKLPTERFPNMPGSDVPIFSTRPDADMAVLGITAALLLRRLIRGECNRFWGTAALLLSVVTTASMHSRAGLIALAVALVLSFACTYSTAPKKGDKRFMMAMAVPVALSVALVGLSQTTPGERLLASITSSSTGSLNEQSARGTERARELTWNGVINWTFDDTGRALLGSGFGNDFLRESGVIQYLEGTEYVAVRSPHNWFVGVLARMGVVGLGLLALSLAAAGLIIKRNIRRIGDNEILTLSAVGVAALLPVAALGVVLESPFGAIPFWWFLGIIMTISHMKDDPVDVVKPAKKGVYIK